MLITYPKEVYIHLYVLYELLQVYINDYNYIVNTLASAPLYLFFNALVLRSKIRTI